MATTTVTQNPLSWRRVFGDAIPFHINNADIASIADGNEDEQAITVAGAALGDFVLITPALDAQTLQFSATVSAANTVEVVVSNNTGGTIDLASQDIWGVVLKKGNIFDEI